METKTCRKSGWPPPAAGFTVRPNYEASQIAVSDGGEACPDGEAVWETAPKHVMVRYFIKAR